MMPTHEEDARFWRDWRRLNRRQREAFLQAVEEFAVDLDRGAFRPSLRVMPMVDHPGIWEMTWEGANGRATFSHGLAKIPGKRHIIWRRVGGHEIYREP